MELQELVKKYPNDADLGAMLRSYVADKTWPKQSVKLKIKKLTADAKIPKYAKEGDAGIDFTATRIETTPDRVSYYTGLAVEIPKGYFGLARPRSSVHKFDMLYDTSGVIDSGYRGELMATFKMSKPNGHIPNIGERVFQLIILPYPQIEIEHVTELSTSERGEGGYGSTGK